MIEITLSGPPIPWTPSRVVRGKFAFSPRFREKEHAQYEVANQYQGPLIEEAVVITLQFYMPIPTTTSKKLRKMINAGEVYHIKKPDIDNCTKYAIDCVKGLIIKDDNQVCEIHATKDYAEIPKTIIRISKA